MGALGSRKTHARRVERLVAAGSTPEQIARIKALSSDIRRCQPGRIAVSVAWRKLFLALRKKPQRAVDPGESWSSGVKFGPVAVEEATGGIVAHSIRQKGSFSKKASASLLHMWLY